MSNFVPAGLGWLPDLPDPRDYTCRHAKVLTLLNRLPRPRRKGLPICVDLRSDESAEHFTPPADQGILNASAAFAVLSLVEYFERRTRGRTFEGSRLFLYKVTRNLLQTPQRMAGDIGADLRTTLRALVQIGVPPEQQWPYTIGNHDKEPSPFLYALAKPRTTVRYFRLDEANHDGTRTWATLQAFLSAGFPVAFGFPVPTSLTMEPNIPFRPDFDVIRGGQAVVAVGYQHHHFGRGQHALLVRSSWGSQWGAKGYGWLPVAYVRHRLARDFWTMVSKAWLDPRELLRPTIIPANLAGLGEF